MFSFFLRCTPEESGCNLISLNYVTHILVDSLILPIVDTWKNDHLATPSPFFVSTHLGLAASTLFKKKHSAISPQGEEKLGSDCHRFLKLLFDHSVYSD